MKTRQRIKIAESKKAFYEYYMVEDYYAGIVLTGLEIKAVRERMVSLSDSYCIIDKGEVFVKNMHISGMENPTRDRKLLLNKSEIKKLQKGIGEKGMTIVPTSVILDEHGKAKVNISLAKGKHTYDKKQVIKERDIDRQMRKEI